jgi:hypothetical protein
MRFSVRKGMTLHEALTAPLVEAGCGAATLRFRDAAVGPFRFVMPGPPDGPTHVAYFTDAVAPPSVTQITDCSATFAWADGKPMVHVHAAWVEADGRRRGGHILAAETVVAAPFDVEAWGFSDIRVEAAFDSETNFTLPQPRVASLRGNESGAYFIRVKPNVDLLTTIESIGLRDATVLGMGSLIGAAFTDGRRIPDNATEVLVRQGQLRDGVASVEVIAVDGAGALHRGWLQRGENPICITFDLILLP